MVVTVEGQPPTVELMVITYVLVTEAERSIVPELEFENTKLALVLPFEHPQHFAVIDHDLEGGETHRDGIRSTYVHDHQGNVIERITYKDINESKDK